MERILRWFYGYISAILTGRQINRFLNLCSKNGIKIWNISYDLERVVKIHMSLKDFYSIRPYLKKTKTHFRIVRKIGFPFWCYRHKKLKWFFVFLAILFVFFLNSLNYVWEIDISGNEEVTTLEILDTIHAEDEIIGKKHKEIDCMDIEYLLREQYNNLGWVSVYIEHTKLYIRVRESLYEEHMTKIEDDKTPIRYDFVANKDANIVSIVTRTGTACVKKGVSVKKGDVLIAGQCEIFDDNGEVKQILSVRADGEIYGNVMYEYRNVITEMELCALNIVSDSPENSINALGYLKFNQFLSNLQKNGVIILKKNVMIEKTEHTMSILGKVMVQEQIGINIPVEDNKTDEFERENDTTSSEKYD